MFKEILDSHKNGILVLNDEFEVCYVNKVLEDLFSDYANKRCGEFLNCFNPKDEGKRCLETSKCKTCNLRNNIAKVINGELPHISIENIDYEAIVVGERKRVVLSLDIRRVEVEKKPFIVVEFYKIKTQDEIIVFNKRLLDDILDILDESVFYKDENLRYIYANKYYCDFVNIKKVDLLGRKDSEVFTREETITWEMTDKIALELGKYSEDVVENGKIYRIKKERIETENGIVIACLIKDITYEKKEMEKAYKDDLTEINNRRAFDRKMEEIFLEGVGNFNLILVDLDYLRDINNNYGHSVGDEYLKATAYLLKDRFGYKNVYRLGGDEFAVVRLSDGKCLKRCNEILQEASNIKIKDIKFSLSVGMGRIDFMETPLENFNRVDKALYESKAKGKGRVTKA